MARDAALQKREIEGVEVIFFEKNVKNGLTAPKTAFIMAARRSTKGKLFGFDGMLPVTFFGGRSKELKEGPLL